jgi:hypothetical protein
VIYEVLVAALIGLGVWRAGKRWPMAEQNRSNRWRFVPLGTASAILALAFPTFGAGLLLAPVAVLMTGLSARRLHSPRGSAYYLGATLTGALALIFVTWIAAVVWVWLID